MIWIDLGIALMFLLFGIILKSKLLLILSAGTIGWIVYVWRKK